MRITLSALSNKKQRKQLCRYWISDPFFGALNFLGYYLINRLPVGTVSVMGAFIAPIAVSWRFPKAMQRAKNNLERLRPDLNQEERDRLLNTRWQNIGRVYAEFSVLHHIWREGRVKIEHEKYILPLLEQRHPVIFIFPHMGNWEVFLNYLVDKDFPVLIMVKPGKNRFEQKIASKGRKRIGLDTKPDGVNTILADAPEMRKVCTHLAQRKHLIIAMDGIQHNQVLAPKLGRNLPALTTNITFAVRLAKRYNAVIIPLWCERLPQTHFIVRVSEPIVITDDASAERAIEDLDKRLESWILAKPEQWFYLHELRF